MLICNIAPGAPWYCGASEAWIALRATDLVWTYPWDLEVRRAGLRLRPYTTKSRAARVGCFISHYRCWALAEATGEVVLVLEDDAVQQEQVPDDFDMRGYGMVSLNDPRGATRRAQLYHESVQASAARLGSRVVAAPMVDDEDVPQGLPGNSAYLVTPDAASALLHLAKSVGAWPNDALACNQLLPGVLGCSARYFYRVSGRQSTLA